MRRILSISFVLASGFPAGLFAQAQQPPDSQQARTLAEQALAGREVVVRLYHDPKNKPRAFERLTVKLDGIYVKTDAVRLAFAAGKTADDVEVSFEQLLASGQAAKTALDRLVQSAQVIQSTFEQVEKLVKLIEQATGRKFVDPSGLIDGYGRGRVIPSTWSLPGSIADSASTAGSAIEQMLRSAQRNIPLDRMLQASKTFQTTAPTIGLWTKNLGLRLTSAVHFAEAVETKLDLSAKNAGQVQAAIDRIVRLGQESASTLEQIAKDGESVRVTARPIELSVRAVERALDKMLEQKALVVTGEDQSDEAVAEVVGEFVHGQYYRAGSLSIWPSKLAPPRYPWCLFQDAEKQPVADAPVKVFIGRGLWDDGLWLWIRNSQLDEKGHLKTPRPGSGGFDKFVFLVDYPEVGEVPVGPHAMELPNEPHRTYTVPMLPKDKWCVFKDALENPMPRATVEVFRDTGWRKESHCWETVTLDEKGRLKPPRDDPRLEYSCFIVSHPDYGTALVEPRWAVRAEALLQSCTVPLVHKDSEAWQRSIWGLVQDEQGDPVNEAVIECPGLRTAGGAHISSTDISSAHNRFPRTVTGEQGAFNFYFPIVSDDRKRLVPPNAQYSLRVIAPKELGLAEYHGYAVAGQETTITMQRQPTPEELPILIFQDEFGPVTDPNKLKKVRIDIKYKGGSRGGTYENAWLKQPRIVHGTCSARADWDGKRYIFEPVEITEKSPETIVFKIKQIETRATIYRGQVVHGVTGQPMRGAFVVTMRHPKGDFSGITPQQWDQLHQLPARPDPCEPALQPLQQIIYNKSMSPVQHIVRTDSDGRFQINIEPGTKSAQLLAFEQDYLAVSYVLRPYSLDGQKVVSVPTIRLYPSATVLIEPYVEQEVQFIRADWYPCQNEEADWLKGFLEFRRNLPMSFLIKDRLKRNTPQRLQVLGGVNISLTLQPGQSSWRDSPPWCSAKSRIFRAAQGQIIDLGKVTFERQIPIYVKVVDSRGQPLEDILMTDSQPHGTYWFPRVPQATDQNGLARFYAPPRHEGVFLVGWDWHRPGPQTPLESMAYQTTGPQDANKVFTFRLSDEILQQVRKQAEQGQGP